MLNYVNGGRLTDLATTTTTAGVLPWQLAVRQCKAKSNHGTELSGEGHMISAVFQSATNASMLWSNRNPSSFLRNLYHGPRQSTCGEAWPIDQRFTAKQMPVSKFECSSSDDHDVQVVSLHTTRPSSGPSESRPRIRW
jgi:hypothetical protein